MNTMELLFDYEWLVNHSLTADDNETYDFFEIDVDSALDEILQEGK